MHNVTREEVARIALLARLTLTPEEQEAMVEHFSQILTHADKMNDLDTDSIEPATHAVEIEQQLREDRVTNTPQPDTLLQSAPTREQNFFKVPKVIE